MQEIQELIDKTSLEEKKEYLKRLNYCFEEVIFQTDNKEIAYQCMLVVGREVTMKYIGKEYIFNLSYDRGPFDRLISSTDKIAWKSEIYRDIDGLDSLRNRTYAKCNTISEVYLALEKIKESEYEARLTKDEEIRAKFRRY